MIQKRRFVPSKYTYRLRLLREAMSGENQIEFAERIGIPSKRWNAYECGYPLPREAAMQLMEKFDEISIEWIWYGETRTLPKEFREKIERLDQLHAEEEAALARLDAEKARLKEITARRKKAIRQRGRPHRRQPLPSQKPSSSQKN